jgi:hypothetical protein
VGCDAERESADHRDDRDHGQDRQERRRVHARNGASISRTSEK